MLDKKIPSIKFLEVYENYDFINSPLVEIKEDMGIIIDMQYPKMGMECAINKCLVRKEVLDMLIKAKEKLPGGITFKIWDAYRPLSLQTELFYKYKDKIIKEFKLENLSEEERNDVIKNYVSLPNNSEEIPPLHATGGAVDLTLVNISTGKDLDMGIDFDAFSDLTNTDAFEKDGMDEVVRKNRRILYNAMTSVGFTNLPSEVWHYDFGDRAWAFYNNTPALYKGILEYKDIHMI